jgi:hypothetical protein
MSRSAMAQQLSPGDALRIGQWGEFQVITGVIRQSQDFPIDITLGDRSSAVGCYFAAKSGHGDLRPGNIFCSNPSCCLVFATTYSEFSNANLQAKQRSPQLGAASAQILLTCAGCGTSRVVDERSFDRIVKI